MHKWILKFISLFNPVFKKQGIDVERMYNIVETKLIMDKRRVYMQWKQKQQNDNRNHLSIVLAVYAFFGLFSGIMIFTMPSLIISMAFVHAYIIFMMAMTLITDFSNVLLDTTDNQVILPRPVDSKTFFMSRLVHIIIYLLQFTVAITIIPLISTIIKYGFLTGIGFCFTALLSVFFAVFFTYILYLLILQFSNEQKVKDIITYFQLFMTILFVAGFQIIPRIINMSALTSNFQMHWYYYLLPPFWMALTLEAIHSLQFDGIHLLIIAVSFLSPLFFFWVLNKYLAPSFSRKLSALNSDGAQQKKSTTGAKEASTLSSFFSNIACRTNTEKAAFEITWKITGRDKLFRLQFYPSLAYIFVFAFIILFKSGNNIADAWHNLPNSNNFLWFIYLPMFSIANSILIIAYNENYQASWIYHSTPIAKPGQIIAGSIKSLFIKFFIPVYLFIFCFSLFIWGWPIIDDFIYGLLNNALCFLLFSIFSEHYFPFSRQPNTQQQTGKVVFLILQFMTAGIFVAIHYFLIKKPIVLYLLLPAIAVGCWLCINKLKNLPWKKIAV